MRVRKLKSRLITLETSWDVYNKQPTSISNFGAPPRTTSIRRAHTPEQRPCTQSKTTSLQTHDFPRTCHWLRSPMGLCRSCPQGFIWGVYRKSGLLGMAKRVFTGFLLFLHSFSPFSRPGPKKKRPKHPKFTVLYTSFPCFVWVLEHKNVQSRAWSSEQKIAL